MNFSSSIPDIVDKHELFKYVSQEQIMHHYTGVSPDTLGAFKSPFRQDKSPSASYYFKNGRLRLVDFGGYFHGDCFDVAAKSLGYGESSRGVFDRVLKDIFKDMVLRGQVSKVNYNMKKVKSRQNYTKIQFQHQEFTSYDKEYWYGRFDFNFPWSWMENLLLKAGIYSAKCVWIEGKIWRLSNERNPMYVYRVPKNKGSDAYYKVYRPFSDKKEKWRNNTPPSIIHGLSILDTSKPCILNKSLKDVIYAKIFDINSYAYQGEFQTRGLLDNTIGILGDNDYPGKRALVKLRQEYPNKNIYMFPSWMEKDFTDNLFMLGQQEMQKFLKDFIQ